MSNAQHWEHVCRTSAREDENAGDYHISVWRLPVEGGWLYKVTEWTDANRDVSVCFVPRRAPEAE